MEISLFIKRSLNRSLYYSAGSIIGKIVGFALLPVYTNYLTPTDYGVIGMLMFFVGATEILFGGRLSQSVPRFYHDKNYFSERNRVIGTSLITTLSISLFSMAIILLYSEWITQYIFEDLNLLKAVQLISLLIVLNALENYGLLYIRLLDLPKLFVAVNICKLCMQLSLNIYLIVYLEMGLLGVVYSNVISTLALSIGLLGYIYSKNGMSFSRYIAIRMLIYCWPLWLSGLIGIYIGSSHQIFVGKLFNYSELGIMNLADKFAQLTLILLWAPFFQFWQVERYKIFNEKNAKEIYSITFKIISTAMLLFGVLISVFSIPIVKIMANESFHAAISIIPVLVLVRVLGSLCHYVQFSFLITDSNKMLAANDILLAGVLTILYLILIPEYGAIGASWGMATSYTIYFFWILRLSKKRYDMNISVPFLAIASLIAFLIFYFLNSSVSYFDNSYYQLGFLSTICFVTIGLILFLSIKLGLINKYAEMFR